MFAVVPFQNNLNKTVLRYFASNNGLRNGILFGLKIVLHQRL